MTLRRLVSTSILALAAFALGSLPRAARADILSDCGNIDIQANAQCTMEVSGGCTAQCTPINFQASCSASLQAQCSGGCTASASASCTGSCDTNCNASCTANPGTFNCEGSCEADCSGNCQAQCASDANQSECTATCKTNCGANCHGQCSGTPPSASCQAQCQASCSGSCTAQANVSCDVKCQESGYASCEANLTGGCQAQCQAPQGALFCDGQYVDVGNNLDKCVNDLKNLLNIQVSGYAYGSCSGNTCQGTAGGSASCGQIAPGGPASSGLLGIGVAAVLAGCVRRRKNAAK
jgi:hypothetical protein